MSWRGRLRLWFGMTTMAGVAAGLGVPCGKRRQILRIDCVGHRHHDARGFLLRFPIRRKIHLTRFFVAFMAEVAVHAEVDGELPHLFDQIGWRNIFGKDLEVGELGNRRIAVAVLGLLGNRRRSQKEE